MDFATLTSKGQVTIPREVRERLRLDRGDRIAFEPTADGRFIVAKDAPIRKSDGAARKRLSKVQLAKPMDKASVISLAVQADDLRIRQGK
jgi:AbrB family looped-hinge helix DNA binding protein